MRPERILMPTDFSDCANAALTNALALARRFGAELHLLHVVVLHQDDPSRPGHAFPGAEELHRRWQEAAGSGMKRLIGDRRTRDLPIVEAQRRGIAAAPEILEYADRKQIDLIVLGTHGRRGLRRFLLGSVAEEVVRGALCPVLTLRDDREIQRFDEVRRIVVPCDFSTDSRRALEAASELAASYQAGIELVHVIKPPLDAQLEVSLLRGYAVDFDHSEQSRKVEAAFRELIGSLGEPAAVKPRILEGPVAPVLVHYADDTRADLIVLARHGLSGLRHFLLGSVSEKVIRSASCPVLTLEPPAEGPEGES